MALRRFRLPTPRKLNKEPRIGGEETAMLSNIDVKKFHTLLEINSLISSSYIDVHSFFPGIVESATRLLDAQASCLYLTNREKNDLSFEAAHGLKEKEIKKHTVKHEEDIAGLVFTNNKPVIANDAVDDKSRLAVPIRLKNECIGVIEVIKTNRKPGFTQEDAEWLEIFASQSAIAITNAKNIEEARGEIDQLKDRLKDDQGRRKIITKSPAVLETLEVIDEAAKTDSSVLFLGESGVGKELFAEQVHFRSLRSNFPFVKVNCATLPDGLLESELFGHVKGAFTNAISNRQGRFEMADGGTIFLDEIGDLPLPLQAKILRVIQEKKFEKVGSDATVTVNVRIVAATNKDLEQQMQNGKFREDLFYRLNVLPVYIPPLRQRPEDIGELARFFLEYFMKETKKQFAGFSCDALDAMHSYSWPGNVRELQNCIERACVIGRNKRIERDDLFPGTTGMPFASERGGTERNLKTAVNIFKANFIRKVLEENHWNQTEASRALAIQRTYLSRLIKELHIEYH
jgi:Nif-specific regulatory protein